MGAYNTLKGRIPEYRKLLNTPYLTVGRLMELLKDKNPEDRVGIKVIYIVDGSHGFSEEEVMLAKLTEFNEELNGHDNIICIGQMKG